MTTGLNDQEWEMLSAYMDGQLSLSEKSQIDQRLLSDTEWAAAYQSLVRTQGILREIPRVKRRRNYFLTPEMVRKAGWLRIIPTLNFSSAAAAILAVLFLILDVFPMVPVMNRALAPQSAAPMVLDSAARPAVEANGPGKSEFSITVSPEVSKEQEQAGGLSQVQVSPHATALPTASILSTRPSEEVVLAPAAPAPENPQILTAPLQPDQAPEGLTAPSMKVAPTDSMAVPSAAQPVQAPQVDSVPAQAPNIQATSQPETQQLEKAVMTATEPEVEASIEPTIGTTPENLVPLPDRPGSVDTQIPPTLPAQETTTSPLKEIATALVTPPSGGGPIIVASPVTTTEPVETKGALPISQADSLIKFGWITLLFISGTLALLSAILKNKSQS